MTQKYNLWEVQVHDFEKNTSASVFASHHLNRVVKRAHQEANKGGPGLVGTRRVYIFAYWNTMFVKKVTVPPFSQSGPWPLFANEVSSSETYEDILDSVEAKRRHEH